MRGIARTSGLPSRPMEPSQFQKDWVCGESKEWDSACRHPRQRTKSGLSTRDRSSFLRSTELRTLLYSAERRRSCIGLSPRADAVRFRKPEMASEPANAQTRRDPLTGCVSGSRLVERLERFRHYCGLIKVARCGPGQPGPQRKSLKPPGPRKGLSLPEFPAGRH